MQEQAVTSMAYIVKRAMDNTIKMEPDFIDARLETKVVSYTNAKKTRVSKAKRRTRFKSSFPVGKSVPLGVLVVMARMRPGSNYNQLTGSKWALPSSILPTGPGTARNRQQIVSDLLTRMISSRRSSVALLKSGWVQPLRVLNASPFMIRRGAKLGSAISAAGRENRDLRTERLGEATIAANGDTITVTCINLAPTGTNQALAARHEFYALQQALPPLQEAVAWEEANITRRIEELLSQGFKQKFIDI